LTQSVKADASRPTIDGTPVMVSGPAHLAAFKRLAGPLSDRADLEELERVLERPLPWLALPCLAD